MKRDPVPETAADDLAQGSRITPHVGWITTSLVFLLVVVKVSVVAHLNLSTALGLIASSSAPSVVVGVLTASLRGIVGYLFFVSLLLTLTQRRDAERVVLRGLMLTLGFLAMFLNPLLLAPVFVLSMGLALPGPLPRFMYRRLSRKFEQSPLTVEAHALWKRRKELDMQARVEARRDRVSSLHESAQETMEEVRRDLEQRGSDVPELQAERLERLAEAERMVELSRAEVAKFDEDLAEAEHLLKDMEGFTAKLDTAAAAAKAQQEREKGITLGAAVAYGVLILVVALSSDRPWLPPERLLANGGDTTVGFVVVDRDGDDLVLHDQPRRLEWMDVEERTICKQTRDDLPWFFTSPSDLLFGRDSPYSDCKSEQGNNETTS